MSALYYDTYKHRRIPFPLLKVKANVGQKAIRLSYLVFLKYPVCDGLDNVYSALDTVASIQLLCTLILCSRYDICPDIVEEHKKMFMTPAIQ